MKQKLKTASLLFATAVASISGVELFAASGPQGDSYESIAQLPDLHGVWSTAPRRGTNSEPVLTPEYAARAREYAEAQARGEIEDTPTANCIPAGMPRIMEQPYPIEVLLSPGKVTMVIEAYGQWRQIFTDGREHPAELDPTFNGHSIGHWEGDVLVVDTVSFVTGTALGRSFGEQHSDQMHIVERIRLEDQNTMIIETTIHDPEALQEPWTRELAYERQPEWNLMEYVCQENNRNSLTPDGKAGVDLEYSEE